MHGQSYPYHQVVSQVTIGRKDKCKNEKINEKGLNQNRELKES